MVSSASSMVASGRAAHARVASESSIRQRNDADCEGTGIIRVALLCQTARGNQQLTTLDRFERPDMLAIIRNGDEHLELTEPVPISSDHSRIAWRDIINVADQPLHHRTYCQGVDDEATHHSRRSGFWISLAASAAEPHHPLLLDRAVHRF